MFSDILVTRAEDTSSWAKTGQIYFWEWTAMAAWQSRIVQQEDWAITSDEGGGRRLVTDNLMEGSDGQLTMIKW